ncbi:MAG: hypothetical protein ACT4PM_00865 [Gemmatimonadales bacterium]
MAALGLIALAAAFTLASWLGWWTIPLLGLIWGWLHPWIPIPERRAAEPPSRPAAEPSSRRATLTAALAGLLGWAIWLAIDTLAGGSGLGRLGPRLAGTMRQPLPLVLAVTLLFPALLAATAAAVGSVLAGLLRPGGPPAGAGSR